MHKLLFFNLEKRNEERKKSWTGEKEEDNLGVQRGQGFWYESNMKQNI